MHWNDLVFCSADVCEFCVSCTSRKQNIDAYESGEIDAEKLCALSVYFFLDLRTVFVQQSLDKARLFQADELHQRIILTLCYVLASLLKQLREFWMCNLEKFFRDETIFTTVDRFFAHRCFPARNFQRFFTQWRSFANDNDICVFGSDGSVAVSWQGVSRKRKTVSFENDETCKKQFISRIDDWISRLNREIHHLH